MRAYRARKRAAGLKRVSEWRPVDYRDAAALSDHRLLDARSLAMHCKIAQKISKDRSLIEIPRRNLERWSQRALGAAPKFIAEWQVAGILLLKIYFNLFFGRFFHCNI